MPSARKAVGRAKALRRRMPDAEQALWRVLRNRRLAGYKFRRQRPIGEYIADFVCLSENLIVEADGGQHSAADAAQVRRDAYLRRRGFRVLRFWNNDILQNQTAVLEAILQAPGETAD